MLELEFHKPADGPGPRGLKFVLFRPDDDGWIKRGGKDIELPLFKGKMDAHVGPAKLQALAEEIIEAEMGASSWSLMHRFNLCHDLLEGVQDDPEAWRCSYAWLRYSAMRRLDWQRRFNTKPRELSHAQDTLTTRLAGIWKRQAGAPIRLPCGVSLLGAPAAHDARPAAATARGPRRNPNHAPQYIKEVQRPFRRGMAPEAAQQHHPRRRGHLRGYLAFLKSNGDRRDSTGPCKGRRLARRLESFERPIKDRPSFRRQEGRAHPGFRELPAHSKSVHSGTDLEDAAGAAAAASAIT